MTREEAFSLWAPRLAAGTGWSDWAKPVLFARIPDRWSELPDAPSAPRPLPELPNISRDAAVVIDLPGPTAVDLGLTLARRGFRPVPLYNGIAPDTAPLPQMIDNVPSLSAVINVWPIVLELWRGAAALRTVTLPDDAPPAFLLDSRRRIGEQRPAPYLLDNRWLCFPTDFPSARVLVDRGISRVLVITETPAAPATDLAHALLRWQQAGLPIHQLTLGSDDIEPITVHRPSLFGAAWYQLLTTFRFRRSLLGGFGGIVPSGGSGG